MAFDNSIKNGIEEKNILFNQLFTRYQFDLRKNSAYIKYEAFKDLKIIFSLYAEIYHFRGYNYNDIKLNDFKKLTNKFDCHRRKELYVFLAKNLIRAGNEEKAKDILHYVESLEIECLIDKTLSVKTFLINFPKLFFRLCAHNLFTLLIFCLIYILASTLIYSPAPYEWMRVFNVEKEVLSSHNILNDILNSITHLFDLETKMKVKPINWRGVIMLVLGKLFFVLVVVNFIAQKIIKKMKFL